MGDIYTIQTLVDFIANDISKQVLSSSPAQMIGVVKIKTALMQHCSVLSKTILLTLITADISESNKVCSMSAALNTSLFGDQFVSAPADFHKGVNMITSYAHTIYNDIMTYCDDIGIPNQLPSSVTDIFLSETGSTIMSEKVKVVFSSILSVIYADINESATKLANVNITPILLLISKIWIETTDYYNRASNAPKVRSTS